MKTKTTQGQTRSVLTFAALGFAILGLTATTATAQTELLSIEFNQDDQEGFDIWPSAFVGTSSTAEFAPDPVATSGTTTATVTTNTGFSLPGDRGNLVDGTPEGFTYAGLYQDLLHASSPTGFFTLDFSGLNPNETYQFLLYAWDPGDNGGTSAPVKEWTVTGGTGDPAVASVDWDQPLLNNDSYALVFDITTTATGTFQLTNTDGLPQSAINGFKLLQLTPPGRFAITEIDYAPADDMVTFTWDSREGATYAIKYSTDLTDWEADLDDGISADAGEKTTRSFNIAGLASEGGELFFRVERQ